jgi:hypothetical protein
MSLTSTLYKLARLSADLRAGGNQDGESCLLPEIHDYARRNQHDIHVLGTFGCVHVRQTRC